MYLCPAAGEAYVYDSLTHPAHRGRHATAAGRLAMHRAFRLEGIHSAFAYVRSDNVSSLKALSSYHRVLFELGFARWHRSGKRRIFGLARHPLYPAATVLVPALRKEEGPRDARPDVATTLTVKAIPGT